MTTDTSERGLERSISKALTEAPSDPGTARANVAREPATLLADEADSPACHVTDDLDPTPEEAEA